LQLVITIVASKKAKDPQNIAGLLLFLFFKRRENEKVCVVLVVVCLYSNTFFDIFQFAISTKITKTFFCFCV